MTVSLTPEKSGVTGYCWKRQCLPNWKRDLTHFKCPCNFPKCVYLKENAECFERMMRERQAKQ